MLWSNIKNQQKHTFWAILLNSFFLSKTNLANEIWYSHFIKEPKKKYLKRWAHGGYFLICQIISRHYRKSDSDERGSLLNSSRFTLIVFPRKILVTRLSLSIQKWCLLLKFLEFNFFKVLNTYVLRSPLKLVICDTYNMFLQFLQNFLHNNC